MRIDQNLGRTKKGEIMDRQTLIRMIVDDWLSTIDPEQAGECLGVDLTYDEITEIITPRSIK